MSGSVKKQKMASSLFGHVKPVPTDEIFNLKILYNSDTHPNKVDLGIGGRVINITMDTIYEAARDWKLRRISWGHCITIN